MWLWILWAIGIGASLGCTGGSGGANNEDGGDANCVRDFRDLEFRSDGLWYAKGGAVPFSGSAVRYYPDGSQAWATTLEDGIPKGRVLEWDGNGSLKWP